MNILLCGDVVGRTGRDAVKRHLPGLRAALAIDLAVVNAENAAHGYGLTERICGELYDAGADILTTGNHVWDQKELIAYIERDPRVLRPHNFPAGTPGAGWRCHALGDGGSVLVVNLMGRLFMDPLDDPFAALDRLLADRPLGAGAAIVVDFHAEATSEKQAFGLYVDGRASLIVGTHTHTPSADHRILPGGAGFITDAGMSGDYDSVIGMDKEEPLRRFTRRLPSARFEPALGPATLCGVAVETGEDGLAKKIAAVRIGGILAPAAPDFW